MHSSDLEMQSSISIFPAYNLPHVIYRSCHHPARLVCVCVYVGCIVFLLIHAFVFHIAVVLIVCVPPVKIIVSMLSDKIWC